MLKTFLPVIAAAAMTASSASAATFPIFADKVLYWTGTNVEGSKRSDTENALGEADGEFLSLGLGGYADFGFQGFITSPGAIVEVTWGKRKGYTETADLFVGNSGDESSFFKVASILNSTDDAVTFTFSGVYDTLRVKDTSPFDKDRDGFDVDAVSVTLAPGPAPSPIPLPASVLLLGAGLASLGVARKMKR